MGLSSILQRIEKKGKVEAAPPTTKETPRTSVTRNEPRRAPSDRPVDPVVARLKEKRRLEREEKERLEMERKGLKPVQKKGPTNKSATAKAAPRQRQLSSKSSPAARLLLLPPPQPQPPKKQLNYAELMKKASSINKDKLSINLLNKSKSPEAEQKKTPPPAPRTVGSHKPVKPVARPVPKPAAPSPKPKPKPAVRAPLPTRQPSTKIKERLEKKRQVAQEEEYDDDDDLDSFVEDDEEEDDYDDTHRKEIWAMFNRGKKRTYYADDYDSDNMEATGAEIFDEEFQSRLDAEREDRREMEEEKRLQALKRKRLNRK
ncbi:hypothetical protein Cantr_00451 [Candida viswanathii]|uniref:Protein SPT2 n=1 Tax=Candida viswanathii TaxID=5486 RepID=A0A367YF16_9ASCO|nr:hypothetical protein Cantr_00451 [Candida viswanathii]